MENIKCFLLHKMDPKILYKNKEKALRTLQLLYLKLKLQNLKMEILRKFLPGISYLSIFASKNLTIASNVSPSILHCLVLRDGLNCVR